MRVNTLLSQMTLEEKLDYMGGIDPIFIRGIPRLGIPQIYMSDGPVGVVDYGHSTAYPAEILSASFLNITLIQRLRMSLVRDA